MTVQIRFKHRFVVVTETRHVAKATSFSYRSAPTRADAGAVADRVNAKGGMFRRAYVADQNKPGAVILR